VPLLSVWQNVMRQSDHGSEGTSLLHSVWPNNTLIVMSGIRCALSIFSTLHYDQYTNQISLASLTMQLFFFKISTTTLKRTILFPPLIKMVTALELWHFSMINMQSLVVPKDSSRTTPALPSFSLVSSSNRGTIRPPVAMAISCN